MPRVLDPADIAGYLDEAPTPDEPAESIVRGYMVRIARQQFSPEELATRHSRVAQVIARSVGKASKPCINV